MSRPTNNEIFTKKVNITRDDCEYEVSYRAMEIYKNKYDCYNDYSIVETDSSKSRCGGYVGSHELRSNKNALTADILTSIKYTSRTCFPGIQKVLEKKLPTKNWGNIKGEEIKENILDVQLNDDELLPYLKAFAYVYYWCGNMMPVPSQPLKMNGSDHLRYKIEHIKNCFEEKYID